MFEVFLKPFDHDQHFELLNRWIRAPHVVQWWGDPDAALAELLKPPDGGGEALILADSTPVGYLRWQAPTRTELEEAGLGDMPNDAVDIDIAIGEPRYLGCGIAAAALRLLVESLGKRRHTIMICTSVDHSAALRAYEKAGFRRRRIFEDPEYGPMWLLTIERDA